MIIRRHEQLLERLYKLVSTIRVMRDYAPIDSALVEAEVQLADYEQGCCQFVCEDTDRAAVAFESFARQCEYGITDLGAKIERTIVEYAAGTSASTCTSAGTGAGTSATLCAALGVDQSQLDMMSLLQVWRALAVGVFTQSAGAAATNATTISAFDTCPECGASTQIRDNNTNAVCDSCGLNIQICGVVFDNSQLYNAGGKCTAKRPYKSKPHVEKHIRALIGETDTVIPPAVIAKVYERMRAEFSRGGVVRSAAEMTCEQVRKWLRAIKYTKYIEVPKIRKLVAEIDGVDLTPERFTSDELYFVTMDTVRASEIFETVTDDKALLVECSKSKIHNRIFYQYILYRVVEFHIKDRARFQKFIEAIHFQSALTLQRNDKIWEQMCKKMPGYVYKPSNVYLLLHANVHAR